MKSMWKVAQYIVPSPLSWLIIGAVPTYAWLAINGSLISGMPY